MLLIGMLLALQTSSSVVTNPDNPSDRKLEINFNVDQAFFDEFDADRDGALSLAEFEKGMDAQVDQALAEHPEAKAKLNDAWRAEFHTKMAAPFHMIDVDSDGRITLAEIKKQAKSAPH